MYSTLLCSTLLTVEQSLLVSYNRPWNSRGTYPLHALGVVESEVDGRRTAQRCAHEDHLLLAQHLVLECPATSTA